MLNWRNREIYGNEKFKCTVCGYIHEGKAAPETCPVCAAPASAFVEIEDAKKKGMLSDKNGNAYIIMYSTVMVVIVATPLPWRHSRSRSASMPTS